MNRKYFTYKDKQLNRCCYLCCNGGYYKGKITCADLIIEEGEPWYCCEGFQPDKPKWLEQSIESKIYTEVCRKLNPSSIIVHNYSSLSDYDAFSYVLQVIEKGKISNPDDPQYCYVTVINNKIVVQAYKNKKSDMFKVWDNNKY